MWVDGSFPGRTRRAGVRRDRRDQAALAVGRRSSAGRRADERFAGSLADLQAARSAVELPLLGKGFFSREEELDELKAGGADAALLLLCDLDDRRTAALMEHAHRIGLDALVEAHDMTELERAVTLGADPIGINARDLSTFRIDRQAQLDLVSRGPRDRILIAESGIETRAQGAAAELAGAAAVLVGSTLMRAPDPAAKLAELISRPLVKVCGLTREEDVAVAVEAGADLCGFILVEASPRKAERVLPVPRGTLSVAVFVGEVGETKADLLQLYPAEQGRVRGRDAVLLREDEVVAKVIDLPWQERDPSHLERARAANGRVMLAGGLGPENVREAIEAVRRWAVDAASSLEREPGVKDHEKVRTFVAAAR